MFFLIKKHKKVLKTMKSERLIQIQTKDIYIQFVLMLCYE